MLDRGEISHSEYAKQLSRGSHDIRKQGTAVFLKDEGKRYLVTARHVLWNDRENSVFHKVFRVPTYDEVSNYREPAFMMSLSANAFGPITLSSPELDLALISLDHDRPRLPMFANDLETSGFEPITLDDIADGPASEGEEIFAVGYPRATALIGGLLLQPAAQIWASSDISLPSLAFGRVSMLHPDLPFFWADMSIYPGNSGGPVIGNDKLVGIVSAQAHIPLELPSVGDQAPPAEILRFLQLLQLVTTRIPFGRIIKADPLRQLLETQKQKDATWSEQP
jgi:hypothetical protein